MSTVRRKSAAFLDGVQRFEEYPSVRKQALSVEIKQFEHLGPGSHHRDDISTPTYRHVSSPVMRKSSPNTVPARCPTPPVGSYDIRRFPESPPPIISSTSSFRNSGRERSLLLQNSNFYQTLNEDISLANLGPGSYDARPSYMGQQLISPTMNDRRFRASRAENRPPSRAATPDSLSGRATPTARSSTPSFRREEKIIPFTPTELKHEIDTVRALPNY